MFSESVGICCVWFWDILKLTAIRIDSSYSQVKRSIQITKSIQPFWTILPWSSIQHPNIELQRTIHLNWCEFGMDLVFWHSNFILESVPIQRLYQFKWIGQTISSDSLSILKNDGLSGIECGQRSLPVKPCMVLYRFFTSFCLSNRWHLKKKLIEIQIQIPTITWLLTKRFDLGIFTLKFYRFVSKA